MTKLNKILMFILLALACFIPALLLSTHGFSSAFLPVPLTQVAASLNADRLVPLDIPHFVFTPQYSGYHMMLLLIAKVGGFSAQQVQFLPIGGIIMPLVYFALAKKLFGSNLIAALIALYVAWDPSTSVKAYNTYAASWTFPLFLTFIILYVRILKQEGKGRETLLLLLVFFATFRLNWSIPVWMIALSIFISIALLIKLVIAKQGVARNQAILSLTMVFIVIYLMWDAVFYHQYLPYIVSKQPLEVGVNNFAMILQRIGLLKIAVPGEYLSPPSISLLSSWLSISRYIVILVPFVAYIFVKFKKLAARRRLRLENLDVFSILIWSFVGVAIWHMISSVAYGIVRFTPILFLFPFVTIACLNKLKARNWLKLAIPVILVLLAVVNFGAYFNSNTPQIKYSDTNPSSGWLANNCGQETRIVGGFNTTVKYLQNGVSSGTVFNLHWLASENYSRLVETEFTLNRTDYLKRYYDYIIINKKFANSSQLGNHWRFYEPFSNYLDEINNNINIDKVYDDGIIWIFRPR